MPKGRPTMRDEMQILKHYNSLMPKCFKVVEAALNSKNKTDQRWAADWLKTGFTKMVPQQIEGPGGGPVEIKLINYAGSSNPLPVSTKEVPATVS